MKVYSVFDKKGQFFGIPIFVQRKIDAIRAFEKAVNQSGTQFNEHPSDFALYYIGEFDDDKGRFDQPEMLMLELDALSLLPSNGVDGSAVNGVGGTRPAAKERQL